ncbi:hypothetical protein QQX98_008079 [Neonectria punicea]|uniref:Bromo domain-containing protein n=1 Tax=Neonectria punicea TaxID=979145 RepID=A0ABR1GXB9_9HYPO
MNQPAAYTPLESLFLFQSLLTHGVDTGAFARISELLINNALIKEADTYDPTRLRPDALQQLFLLLLRDELKSEEEGQDGPEDATGSPTSKKRKLASPPLPTLKVVYENVDKVPILVNRLYARYRDHVVKQIREDERRFETVQKEIQLLERTERERRARAATQNGTPILAPREVKPAVASNGPTPTPTPTPNSAPTPAAIRRAPTPHTPVIPPKPPTPHVAPPTVAPPSHLPSGTPPIRPSPSPKPPNGTGSVLQAPAGVPPSGPRPLQPPPQAAKQAISPRPEIGIKPKDGAATPQAATPVGAALKWEKPYQPPHAPTPPPRQFQSPIQQSPTVPPGPQQPQQQHQQQSQQQQQQQQWYPQPTAQFPTQAAGQQAHPLPQQPPQPQHAQHSPRPQQPPHAQHSQQLQQHPQQQSQQQPQQHLQKHSQQHPQQHPQQIPPQLPPQHLQQPPKQPPQKHPQQHPQQHAQQQPQKHSQQHPQQHPQPPPHLQRPQQPQTRPTPGKPLLVPPPNAGQLAPPLQPAPPRPKGDVPIIQAPQARPPSTTPVPHPTRPIQPPQPQAQQVPRPIASASPTPPTGTTGPIAPHQQRWPHGYQPQPGQNASQAGSSVPLASQKDKAYSSPYVAQPPRPAIPEHVIRQAMSTPAKRYGTPSAPQTPVSATPAHLLHGFGTRWSSHSTPSTPKPLITEPESPAFEPVSPPQQAATLPSSAASTPRPLPKKQTAKPVPKIEPVVNSARSRSSRRSQKGRGVSATPSLPRRRSQSVMSHTDEPATESSEPAPKIKDEDATPRPTEETGDTTADESVPGRPQIVTPGSVSSRLQKRKRQETPPDPPPPTSQVLWTRGFTKVSSSALDQISSHRDANMFATALREKDAPNYRQIVLQPQDITSIRSAIKHGNKAAVQAANSLPGGDPATAHVWLPLSDELVPPKGIINSAQLERELVHMFCNAIMYNPDPDRGPGPGFMQRSQDEEEEVVGYRLDENGIVKNTRSMFVEVEKLLGDLRSAEKERSAPPPSSTTRPASVATPAEDTAEDDDETAGEREASSGTAKRRRVGTRG